MTERQSFRSWPCKSGAKGDDRNRTGGRFRSWGVLGALLRSVLPGAGLRRCPECQARPFARCREWPRTKMSFRHYERYRLERDGAA